MAQELGELIEHPDDLARTSGERFQDVDDWPPCPKGGFSKAYSKAHIRMCLLPSGYAPQWGAVFQSVPVKDFGNFVGLPELVQGTLPHRWGHPDQALMFAQNVKSVEGEQNIVPSLVWLEFFDLSTVSGGKAIYLFDSAALRINERKNVVGNRKINIFWPYCAVSFGKGDSEKIKAATDHIYDRSSFRVDDQGKWLPDKPRLDDIISGITIWLSDRGVRATLDPSVNAVAQNFDLGYGPINGCLGT